MTAKISVIIPIYNVESYLRQCLDSIVNQTFQDIEIICINDKSTDSSLSILNDYAQKDSRIIILENDERKGQAFSRNKGIEIAKGEFIGFIDADDWADFKMLENLYNKAIKTDSDVVMCQAAVYDDSKNEMSYSDTYYSLDCFDESFDNKVFSAEETKDFLLKINVTIWNKLYKKDFLIKINAKFAEDYIYEDLPFFFNTYLRAEKMSIVRECLYFYRINRTNSTMNQLGKKILDRVPMVSLSYEILKSCSFFHEIKPKIIGWIIDDIFHRYTLTEKKYQMEYYYLMKKLFLSLDIKDINKNILHKCYSYLEFSIIKKQSFIVFNKKLFSKYKNSKKLIKQTQHKYNILIEEIKDYWLEENNKQRIYLENLRKKEKDDLIAAYEKIKNDLIDQYENQLSKQKSHYEQELDHVRLIYKIVKKTKSLIHSLQNKWKKHG